MTKKLCLALLLLINSQAWTQTKNVTIHGTLTNDQNEILSNISVTLWEDKDSVKTVNSNSTGEFSLTTTFNYSKAYLLTFDYKYQSQTDIVIFEPADSVMMSTYTLDIQLVKNIYNNIEENSAIYFERNKTSGLENYDLEYLKLLIEQNPTICLNMYYMGSNQEKKELGSVRIKNLRNYLSKNNIPMDNIIFTDDKIKIRAYEKDQRALFLISVNSLEGCK